MIPIHPLAKIFPAIEGAAFDALKAGIAANGLSVPITLWRGAILDGRNRYRALVELGLVPAEARAEDLDSPPLLMPVEHVDGLEPGDLPAFVISRNLNRRHLTESQRATVAASLVSYGHGGDRRARGTAPDQAANLPVETAITTQRAAEMLRVSERSVRDARALFKGPIQLVEDVQAGRVAVSAAAQALRQEMQGLSVSPSSGPVGHLLPQGEKAGAAGAVHNAPQVEQDAQVEQDTQAVQAAGQDPDALYARIKARIEREKAEAKAAQIAAKKAKRAENEARLGARIAASNDSLAALGQRKRYGIILADPEWRFETRSEAGKDRSAENHYPCSSLDDIKARPVAGIAAEDCLLLLWATVPLLPAALEVMDAWGFGYRSHLIWAKDRIGTGYWNRNQHELLLIGVKGDIPAPLPGTQPPSILDAPVGAHSEKPPFAHEYAELCWPSLPKIELNARTARPGWDVWGAESPEPPRAMRWQGMAGMAAGPMMHKTCLPPAAGWRAARRAAGQTTTPTRNMARITTPMACCASRLPKRW